MDYPTLIADVSTPGSIKFAINYTRIDSAGILDEAEKWIYSKLRLREMQIIADVAIAQGASQISAPQGFLDPIQFGIPGYINDIVLRDLQRFRASLALDTSGELPVAMPTAYAISAGNLLLNHKADMTYSAKMAYYGSPESLSSSNPTNFLTDRYPTLLRRACLMYAAEARKEFDLMNSTEIKALAQIEDIKKEGDLAMRGMELDFNWEEAR